MIDYKSFKVSVPEGQSGPWKVEVFFVPKEKTLENMRIAAHGMMTVPPGKYTRLIRDGAHDPTMSDTPAEIMSHLNFIRTASGRVLLNGLGIGMILKALLEKPEVTHIDIVEKSQDVVNLVWSTYSSDPRATLHVADAFVIKWPKGTKWDFAWHDIWDSICGDNWPQMVKLHRKYSKLAKNQDSWQRNWVRRLFRQGY